MGKSTFDGLLRSVRFRFCRAARREYPIVSASNASFLASHVWTNSGDYTITLAAYNADNPGGVSANLPVHILPLNEPLLLSASFGLLSTNVFQFQFTGQSNAVYTVQMATNLAPPIAWQNLQMITSTGGLIQLSVTNATNETGFYRVLAQ